MSARQTSIKPEPEWALITGASTGIGYAIATEFIKKGYNVVLVSQNKLRLQQAAASLRQLGGQNTQIYTISVDLSNATAPRFIYNTLKRKKIHTDTLVNNAGIGTSGPFTEQPYLKDETLIKVNVLSLAELCYLFLKDMLKKGRGTILNVASVAAFPPGPLMSTYYASKAFVLRFSEALYTEARPFGVLVSALCPGHTGTPFHKRSGTDKRRHGSGELFSGSMSAQAVAQAACRGIRRKKPVIVPGLYNKILVFLIRWGPRSLVRKIVFFLNAKVKKP